MLGRWPVVGRPRITGNKHSSGRVPRRTGRVQQMITWLAHLSRRRQVIPLLLLLLATGFYQCRRRLDETEEADAGVLEQRSEHHYEAGNQENVDALEVGVTLSGCRPQNLERMRLEMSFQHHPSTQQETFLFRWPLCCWRFSGRHIVLMNVGHMIVCREIDWVIDRSCSWGRRS